MPPNQPDQPDQLGPSRQDKIDKLSIAVYSGEFDKVHYALVMAAGAAATNTPVTLFFTMGACRGLEKTPEGMEPPWRAMPVSQGGHLDGDTGGEVDDGFAAKGVATFEELVQSCVAMGVRFMVCEMGLRAMDMTREDLRDDVPYEDGGVVTFLADTSPTGTTLFI